MAWVPLSVATRERLELLFAEADVAPAVERLERADFGWPKADPVSLERPRFAMTSARTRAGCPRQPNGVASR